jgi:hypothetical protein
MPRSVGGLDWIAFSFGSLDALIPVMRFREGEKRILPKNPFFKNHRS